MIELIADDSKIPLKILLYNALDYHLSSIKSSSICVLFFCCESPNFATFLRYRTTTIIEQQPLFCPVILHFQPLINSTFLLCYSGASILPSEDMLNH